MTETDNNFRPSLVGGFNKEDVISYITKKSSEYTVEMEALNAKVVELTGELEAAKARAAETEAAASEANDRAAKLKEELGAALHMVSNLENDLVVLEKSLQAKEGEAEALEARAADLEKKLEQALNKCEGLNAVISGQSDRLEDLEQSKLRVADIELAAYERAGQIERAANERAAALLDGVNRLYEAARDRYAAVNITTHAKTLAIVDDIKTIMQCVESLPGELKTIGDEIAMLSPIETPQEESVEL